MAPVIYCAHTNVSTHPGCYFSMRTIQAWSHRYPLGISISSPGAPHLKFCIFPFFSFSLALVLKFPFVTPSCSYILSIAKHQFLAPPSLKIFIIISAVHQCLHFVAFHQAMQTWKLFLTPDLIRFPNVVCVSEKRLWRYFNPKLGW